MKVELKMYINENDESTVMQKVSEVTKHAKGLGFKIGELELKNKRSHDKHRWKKDKEDSKKHNRHHHYRHHHHNHN